MTRSAPVAEWRALLGREPAPLFVAPRPAPEAFGHGTAGAALKAAGGLPGSGPLLVIVNDPDRATRTADALRAIRGDAPDRLLRVLVATGTHHIHPVRRAAHERMLREAAGEVAVEWHDADAREHDAIDGAHVDRRVLSAAEIVVIGSVEPHWFAGLTGAYKALSVGVMSRADITDNHRLALDTAARPLRLDGNPLHQGLAATAAAVARSREVVALQHVGDRWVAGDVLGSLRAALPAAREMYEVVLDAPAAAVVACVRPPLDRSLYQAEKGLKLCEHAVADGGAIVLDANCADGIGPDRFVRLLEDAPDEDTARHLVRSAGYRLGDHKAVRWRALQARGVNLAVVSRTIPADAADAAGLAVTEDRAAAAAWLSQAGGVPGPLVVVDDAAHVVLSVRGSE